MILYFLIDKANDHNSNILLILDFNIDLCKSQPAWDTTTSLFGFHQLLRNATRITSITATLIDHITMVSEVLVSTASISDHSLIFCTWSFKLPKRLSKGHTSIEYTSFKNFTADSFLFDLSTMPFHGAFWNDAFLPVVNKHASLRRERVKHPKLRHG